MPFEYNTAQKPNQKISLENIKLIEYDIVN